MAGAWDFRYVQRSAIATVDVKGRSAIALSRQVESQEVSRQTRGVSRVWQSSGWRTAKGDRDIFSIDLRTSSLPLTVSISPG